MDTSFVDPNANGAVYSAAIQQDGKVLAGGAFISMGGQTRNYLARLMNDTATQSFVLPNLTRFQWFRGGSSPEAQDVTFDLSTDGGNIWQPLGNAVRITGGWQMDGLNLPNSGLFRCRARAVGGIFNGSSGLIEQIASFGPDIVVEQPAGTNIADGGSKGFGSVFVGANNSLPFTIKNAGTGNLTGLTITKDGANSDDFTVTVDPTAPVAIGGSTTFTVQFAPTSTGSRSATLHIASNDPDEDPFDITLTGTGVEAARLTNPAPGSTLTSATATFTWSAGFGVSEYYLSVGSTVGGNDIYYANQGSALTRIVTIPTDGRTLHVKLWSKVDGVWWYFTYTLTAWREPPPLKAQLVTPVNGSTLVSTSLPLTWNAGVNVTSYYLYVGTAAGGYDIYAGNQGNNLSCNVTLPADRNIHVTLWSLIKGAYQANSYVFNPVASTKATLATPADGSTLSSSTLSLSWTTGVGVSKCVIWIGSSYGGYDLGAVDVGTGTAWSSAVPQDGGPIYVTLWSLINGGYQGNNYWFNTALPVSGNRQARITNPANASTLGSATMNLTWDAGVGVSSYALWVGSTPNGYDLYSGLEGTNLAKSVAVPGDGRRVHVTLHSLISGAYQSNSYWFTAPTLPDGGAAQVTSPVNGSTLADLNLPLTWSPAAGATQYYIFTGSTPGGYDLYAGSQGTSLSRTLSGMPVDGRVIYVTLYSWLNGAWKQSTAWFTTANTASGNKRALITTPTNGTTLPSASTTFNWGGGVGQTQYALWIGSSPGAYDLWSSAETAANTSRTVTLPTDGRKLYVTLYSFISGAWQGASYIYTASNVAVTKAAMTSPVNGSTVTGASQTFNWSASNSATMYALWIGRYPGAYDIYAGAEGTNLTRTVNSLPADGSPVYVTLYSLINGAWQSNEYIYNAALPP